MKLRLKEGGLEPLHLPARTRGLRLLTERFEELRSLEKEAVDVAVKDAKFEGLLRKPSKVGSKILSHLRLVFNMPTLSVAAALAALYAHKKRKTGCFRYEFDHYTGNLVSTCKVAECSCESVSTFTQCGPELLTPTQRRSRRSDCSSTACIACDVTADTMSANHLPIDEVPLGVRYACETPSLLDVYGDLVGKTIMHGTEAMGSAAHYFNVTLKWALVLVPIVGIVAFLIIVKRITSYSLSWVDEGENLHASHVADTSDDAAKKLLH